MIYETVNDTSFNGDHSSPDLIISSSERSSSVTSKSSSYNSDNKYN